ALAALAAGGGGLAYYAANDAGARRMVEVELAGSVDGIVAVVGRGLATVDPYRQALGADDVLVAG
ncbi:MAG TPA: hypothetical protein VKP11_07505, partial [Frankiaceae bacterium]|nr:hypothetical protein [Frankiaceae bacterium]